MDSFDPPNLWKRHGVLLGICTGRKNKEITDFLSISKGMVEKVREELEDSRFNYEATFIHFPLWCCLVVESWIFQFLSNLFHHSLADAEEVCNLFIFPSSADSKENSMSFPQIWRFKTIQNQLFCKKKEWKYSHCFHEDKTYNESKKNMHKISSWKLRTNTIRTLYILIHLLIHLFLFIYLYICLFYLIIFFSPSLSNSLSLSLSHDLPKGIWLQRR